MRDATAFTANAARGRCSVTSASMSGSSRWGECRGVSRARASVTSLSLGGARPPPHRPEQETSAPRTTPPRFGLTPLAAVPMAARRESPGSSDGLLGGPPRKGGADVDYQHL